MKNKLNSVHLERELNLFSAFILVVANMIGTGIFTTSGFIMKELGNPVIMLICWLFGGIFALCGALCYAELGAMFPHSGGEYVFHREGFGKGMAFLSGWISLIVGFSAPIAAASVAFASYFFKAAPIAVNRGLVIPILGVKLLILSPVTLLAAATIVIFSFVHYHSLFLGSRVQNGLTLFKILFILLFAIAGFWFGTGAGGSFQPCRISASSGRTGSPFPSSSSPLPIAGGMRRHISAGRSSVPCATSPSPSSAGHFL